jgi:hypothetical protein
MASSFLDPLPQIRRIPVNPRQRALEHHVLLHRPRLGPGPLVRQEPPACLPREVGRWQLPKRTAISLELSDLTLEKVFMSTMVESGGDRSFLTYSPR